MLSNQPFTLKQIHNLQHCLVILPKQHGQKRKESKAPDNVISPRAHTPLICPECGDNPPSGHFTESLS